MQFKLIRKCDQSHKGVRVLMKENINIDFTLKKKKISLVLNCHSTWLWLNIRISIGGEKNCTLILI